MDRHLLVLPGARLTVRNLHFRNGLLSNDVQAQGGAVSFPTVQKPTLNTAPSRKPSLFLHSGKAEGGAVFGGTHLKTASFATKPSGGNGTGRCHLRHRGEYRECRFEENQAITSTAKAPAFGGAANEGNFTDCLFLNNKSIAVGQSSGGAPVT